jgi:hypothetical protein
MPGNLTCGTSRAPHPGPMPRNIAPGVSTAVRSLRTSVLTMEETSTGVRQKSNSSGTRESACSASATPPDHPTTRPSGYASANQCPQLSPAPAAPATSRPSGRPAVRPQRQARSQSSNPQSATAQIRPRQIPPTRETSPHAAAGNPAGQLRTGRTNFEASPEQTTHLVNRNLSGPRAPRAAFCPTPGRIHVAVGQAAALDAGSSHTAERCVAKGCPGRRSAPHPSLKGQLWGSPAIDVRRRAGVAGDLVAALGCRRVGARPVPPWAPLRNSPQRCGTNRRPGRPAAHSHAIRPRCGDLRQEHRTAAAAIQTHDAVSTSFAERNHCSAVARMNPARPSPAHPPAATNPQGSKPTNPASRGTGNPHQSPPAQFL